MSTVDAELGEVGAEAVDHGDQCRREGSRLGGPAARDDEFDTRERGIGGEVVPGAERPGEDANGVAIAGIGLGVLADRAIV